MAKIIERRLHPRTTCPANFIIKDEADKEVISSGVILNIGAGGMLIKKNETTSNIPLGKRMKINLVFSEDKELILTGEVIREQEKSLAVYFLGMTKPEQKKLIKLTKGAIS